VTGVALGITLLIAVGRIYTKISKFHRLFVDDGFFILATILLVAGTALQLVALPYGQTSINVGAGVESPPPDLVQQLVKNLIFQTSSIILLYASVFSVKFSFLFFFRLLLQRTDRLRIWWWCVTIFTIPCAVVCMCTPFMICSTFDDHIIGKRTSRNIWLWHTEQFL
jgi:heme/copper-type cytochrome/quinol oxidase subunit 2